MNIKSVIQDNYINNAAVAHAMIMILHSMDNHLADGQIKPEHLVLLIRSQAWKIFSDAISVLCSIIDSGTEIVKKYIDSYYRAITVDKVPSNLEEYLDCFRHQMATGLIVPLLMARITQNISMGFHCFMMQFVVLKRLI